MLSWKFTTKPPTWQDLYQSAVLESDPSKHLLLSNTAEQAIYKRFAQLENIDYDERRSLQDALGTLAHLRRVRISGPSPASLHDA